MSVIFADNTWLMTIYGDVKAFDFKEKKVKNISIFHCFTSKRRIW
jgi:hypothetical protein